MTLPKAFEGLRLPAIAAPMFLTSGPDLVVEVCRSGVVGTFPALNQRSTDGFVAWLEEIATRLEAFDSPAPYGVNLIVHRSNPRLRADLEEVVRHRVPLVITSLGAVADVVDAVHSYGGLVFHDVISRRHAEKAAEAGVDGIIAVAAGAGGHAGQISPFALVSEIRSVFGGAIALSGAMSTGAHIAAARAMGADLAYIGSPFIATEEANAQPDYKQMIVDSTALPEQAVRDIVNGAFRSAGQRCSALRCLYVQEDIAPHLIEMIKGAMDELTVGDPWALSTDVGPVIDPKAHSMSDAVAYMTGAKLPEGIAA